ncbi:Nicotinate dehydrogenase FAD-subunit [Sporomusa ovata DSM 2662]|uniref:Xanthine dehydrogenase, FAD binding subunit n=1 Tax=Sporomusa ovata TaxID=2378 RepID=A0A0U1KY71_9FIRM|nr:xanthine dehydrogenase family protein subunit M [Sporomusa ovata]EQB28943.1 aerobic-type carbon monoxide dehydrogenase, middle subunit CoxM/CutM-like protein [Sporomusa ovata DSM 2662]CQR72370.1 Xanthine dehydrogenase, FAD binding subunit [Sporomusa ovata]
MSCSYYAPQRLEELLAILAEKKEKAKVLAGGTDLVIALQEGKLNYDNIVALHKIPELKGITMRGDTIVIGAMTTHTEVERSPIINTNALLLAQAAAAVGSPQIRNAGTLGGNICNASPAADTVPALIALDACVKIVSKGGEREMPLEDLFLGMGKTKLGGDEVIKEISFNALPDGAGSIFVKLARRNALAISRISVAAIVTSNEYVTDCRIAMGAVAPNPFRVRKAEKAWLGRTVTADNLDSCVEAAFQEISATLGQRASAIYKKRAGKALIRRALSLASGQM